MPAVLKSAILTGIATVAAQQKSVTPIGIATVRVLHKSGVLCGTAMEPALPKSVIPHGTAAVEALPESVTLIGTVTEPATLESVIPCMVPILLAGRRFKRRAVVFCDVSNRFTDNWTILMI